MAEVKSSLEIAMERADAMGAAGKDDLLREDGQKCGQTLARKCVTGDVEPQALTSGIEELESGAQPYARKAAAEILLSALAHYPQQSMAGLEQLAGADSPALASLRNGLKNASAIGSELDAQLGQELAGDLAQAGISGSAVRPNPQAHPQFGERLGAALAPTLAGLNQAGQELLKEVA